MITKIISLAQANEDILVLWLYGSRANDTASSHSDYDLAIAFKHFPKDDLERHLRPEILALEWAKELNIKSEMISIVDINLIPIPLAWEVISRGKEIYVRDQLRYFREEMRISSRYELDILYHRRRYGS